ncbi:NUDIX hydrolase [Robertkochia solimangrovi]|uniref:NUDIX hydrolase n=1 Tax=Robertkochia solimangrovi TaxID=2213046 RepID=UPI00117DFBBD|nr:NUDIX domain-containing protein [Robertkochia solimangrovi]TRZ41097.1 hydrolase [Robertkochia solimangrovi]
MDELIDILNEDGAISGKQLMKSEAHRLGLLHPTIHVWVYDADGKILLQQRSFSKDTFPGMWDVSVAGHIGAGEDPAESALRELEEEIGMQVEIEDLEFIGTNRHEVRHNNGIIDREMHYVYLCPLKVPFDDLKLQHEEVHAIRFISVNAYEDFLKDPENLCSFVPHDENYQNLVFPALKNISQ